MKKFLTLAFLIFLCAGLNAQYRTSEARSWDRYPPEAQQRGFGLHTSKLLQMDDDPQMEEVFLFTSDNGHYPYFDIFKTYVVIVDYYTKEIEYKTEITLSTEKSLHLEDRNSDGKFELYRRYIQDGKFSVDKDGNNLVAKWVYDCISND